MKQMLGILMMLITLSACGEPKVTWSETTHDFGIIREDDGPVSYDFEWTNEGPGKVVITGVRGTCGCTTYVADKNAVASGKTSTVKVSFSPKNMMGSFDKRLYVTLSGTPSDATLVVTGTVIASDSTIRRSYPVRHGKLYFASDTMAFGTLAAGSDRTVYIDVYNASTETVKAAFLTIPECMEAEPTVLNPGLLTGIPVKLTLPPSTPKGPKTMALTLAPDITLQATVTVK